MFRLERTWREHGQAKRTRRYGITSLPLGQADAARLLAPRRGHWSSENRLHRHEDVAFDEDANLIHVRRGPTAGAPPRDAALSPPHRAGVRRIAARFRAHSQHPARVVTLVGPLPTGA